jgi:hypothetical protein
MCAKTLAENLSGELLATGGADGAVNVVVIPRLFSKRGNIV